MAGAAGALIRAALTARLGYLRVATASYLRDQAESSRRSLDAYLIGAGFYVVAGVFMIAALLVGAAALFHWIGMRYGVFTAFGITAGALIALSLFAVAIAGAATRKPKKTVPSLGSRLRVAMRANPSRPAITPQSKTAIRHGDSRDRITAARNTTASVFRASADPSAPVRTPTTAQRIGAAVAIGLMGWALARRYAPSQTQAPQTKS